MGKHHDRETNQFIDILKKKGEALGFKVTDELSEMSGDYFIDLVWTPYEQSHDIFITFEIESEENERVYKNLDKIFELPSADLEKPYHHFIIIYKGILTRGNKRLLAEKASKKNVHIFEDIKNNTEEFQRLYQHLDALKISITEYIKRQGKANPAETIKETILGLGEITPLLLVENQQYPISQATITSGSQQISEKSLAIPHRQIFDSKKYRSYALVPIPREQYVLVIPGTAFSIDIFLEINKKGSSSQIIAETCNYPFIFKITSVDNKYFELDLDFDREQTDFVQLDVFEDIAIRLDVSQSFDIFDFKGHHVIGGKKNVGGDMQKSEAWYKEFVNNAAHVQKKIGQRILVPKEGLIHGTDIATIAKLKNMLDSEGELIVNDLLQVSLVMTPEVAKRLFSMRDEAGVMPPQKIQSESSEMLFDREIKLGPMDAFLPQMKFEEGFDFHKNIEQARVGSEITVNIVPVLERRAKFVYPDWKRKKTARQ